MKCPKCQYENRKIARFCKKCGEKLELACPVCGFACDPDSLFCDQCGQDMKESKTATAIDYNQPQSYTPKYLADKILTTRSSIEGERKLVTVLFADVANYTSNAEKLDPEEVHQMMDGCFKILMDEIHRYEGTVNQFTGDGVMALFGAPVAHEDHGQRACHAALSIQKAMDGYGERIKGQHSTEFKMRIGLNSGPVIVGSIGDDLRMDYTAVGDTTNLAHRMQDAANPGSVLVSGNTHRLTRDFFEFESLGKVEVKGKEEPQEAYELIRPTEVETRIEAAAAKGFTKFVGREKEMEALTETFDKAKSGSGRVAGVVGEAGVGKSRLLLELRGMLPEGEHAYLEGRCLHYGGSMPYLPILDVLKAHFHIEEEDREVTIKEKLQSKIRELDKKAETVQPALLEVLSLKVEDEKYVQLGPQQRRERTFEAIRDQLIRESQRKPVILAVEDLHWIDKTSEDFLDYLIGFLPTARILLILLYRPEYTHTWGSKSYYSKIGLDQLSAQTSTELVQAILEGGNVAPEIASLVLGKAGGNPLFVEELTHSLIENGSIQKKEERYILARKPSEIEIPDTIQGIIAARMDRIEDNLKRIMQVASVIGREFAYRILQSITGMSEDLKASMLNLQGLEFIYEKQLFPELEYIFKHALTQEVAYNSLLVKRRKEIHEKIGQAIETLYSERLEEYYELLAYHYVRSDNKRKAVAYLSMASEKASRTSAVEEAKTYFDECMKLLDTMPDTARNREHRIGLLVNSHMVFALLLRVSEQHEFLTRYEFQLAGIDRPSLVGAFYENLGYCQWHFGSFAMAIKTMTKAIELFELSQSPERAAHVNFLLSWAYVYTGQYEKVLASKDIVLRKASILSNRRAHVTLIGAFSYALGCLGRWRESLGLGQKALSVAHESSDGSLISWAEAIMSLVSWMKGDASQAIKYGELAAKNAATPLDKAWAQIAISRAWSQAGRPEKGIEAVEPLYMFARDAKLALIECYIGMCLAQGYLLTQEYEEAKTTAEATLALADRCGMRNEVGWNQRLLGEIALATDPDEAAPMFDEAISTFREIKAENELALAYADMGRYHKLQGDLDESRKCLTVALEIFERLGTQVELEKVRKEFAELLAGG